MVMREGRAHLMQRPALEGLLGNERQLAYLRVRLLLWRKLMEKLVL